MTVPRWAWWLLWPFSILYGVAVRIKSACYRRGWWKPYRIGVSVLSVGNLTVGGTGKTPVVLWLARWLHAQGVRTAILTRGYGRRDRLPLVMNGLGDVSRYTPDLMGDEPILFARHVPEATIGIGADRILLARQILALERNHPPGVFLLDDGFQHQRLARDLDIVVLDASDPFGGGSLLPAGLLREPLSALRRADVIIVTRADAGVPAEVSEVVSRWAPRATIVPARTELDKVFDLASDREANLFALKQQPAFAFCAIGNPQAFWRDLERWGFRLSGRKAFPDHTRYTGGEVEVLGRLAGESGARVLLTTEKDKVNLTGVPPFPLPVFYCRAQMKLDEPEALIEAVRRKLRETRTSDVPAD